MSTSPHMCILQPGSDSSAHPLVLLHGSYGTESDLLALADRVAPGAARLGVRGTVAMDSGYAFVRRDADRRVDEADLWSRVPVLADLLRDCSDRGWLTRPPVVIGFSNGAIMAAALVATCPALLAGAVLFRPLSPFSDDQTYRRSELPVLLVDGARDHRRSPGDGRLLAERLARAEAGVTHCTLDVGHSLTPEDEVVAREWVASLPART